MIRETTTTPNPSLPSSSNPTTPGIAKGPVRPRVPRPDSRNLLERMKRDAPHSMTNSSSTWQVVGAQ